MIEKPKTIIEQQEWREILKEVHLQNIPIEFHRQNGGLAQLYANHVPKELYVKHSYQKLKSSLIYYIKEFQEICHKTLQNNQKKYKAIQEHQEIIRLGLEEITEELGFLNLKPISQIMHYVNTLIFRVSMNFVNFVKSIKKTYFSALSNTEGRKQNKDLINRNICFDCKGHRQEMLIQQLKRKLNMNKIQVNVNVNPDDPESSNQDEKDPIKNYQRVKRQIKQALNRQQSVIPSMQLKNIELDKNNNFSQMITSDILMNEKQCYIQQVNALLQGRQVHETSNTKAYTYLVKELMEFPHLDKLNEEVYAKQAEKITQKIQSQLFENFMATLSDPLKKIFKKVLSNRYLGHQKVQQPIPKIKKISVEVQTSSLSFEQKIKELQKQLQKQNFQLNYIKHTKQQLEKKYLQKYQEQRENQKQIHEQFLTMRQLQRKIKDVEEEKQILHDRMENEKSIQLLTMKKVEDEFELKVSQIRAKSQKKYNDYRQKLNEEASARIKKINEEKNSQISYFKAMTEKKLQHDLLAYQSLNTLNSIKIQTLNEFPSIAQRVQQNKLNSIKQKFGKQGKKVQIVQLNNYELKQSTHNQNDSVSQQHQQTQYENTYQNKQLYLNHGTKKPSIEEQKSESKELHSNNQSLHYKDSIRDISIKISHDKQSIKKELVQRKETKNISKRDSNKSIDLILKMQKKSMKNISNIESLPSQYIESTINIDLSSSHNYSIGCTQKTNLARKVTERKTVNEHSKREIVKKNYTVMQTQKSSPVKKQEDKYSLTKNFSSRKFKKTIKQVQFDFVRKTEQSQYSILQHKIIKNEPIDQNSRDSRQNIEQKVAETLEQKSVKRKSKLDIGPKSKKTQNSNSEKKVNKKTQVNRSNNKNQNLQKTIVKFTNITLERNDQMKSNINLESVSRKQKSMHSLKKSQKNQKQHLEQEKSSIFLKVPSFSSQIHHKFQPKVRGSDEISLNNSQRLNEMSSKRSGFQQSLINIEISNQNDKSDHEFTVQATKQLIENNFSYLKMVGLIDRIHILSHRQETAVRHRILTVAKTILLSLNSKQKLSLNSQTDKDPFTKTHKALRQILTKSMNKMPSMVQFDQSQLQKLNELSEQLLKEMNKVSIFSPVSRQDLDIFGGREEAEIFQTKNRNQAMNLQVVNNHFKQQIVQVARYFQKLSLFNWQKYAQYITFLKFPIATLSGKSKEDLNKMIQKNKNKQEIVEKDSLILKIILGKILSVHQKEHQKTCIHLQKFLKKIGFFKYSN